MKLDMTTQEFDQQREKLEKLIHQWWKEEQSGWSIDKKAKEKKSPDIMTSLPVIDSKVAITVSTVLEDVLGKEIHPSLIKKGGYGSIEEMAEDLLGKLRECCKNKKRASGQN